MHTLQCAVCSVAGLWYAVQCAVCTVWGVVCAVGSAASMAEVLSSACRVNPAPHAPQPNAMHSTLKGRSGHYRIFQNPGIAKREEGGHHEPIGPKITAISPIGI